MTGTLEPGVARALDFLAVQPHAAWAELRENAPVAAGPTQTPGGRPVYYVTGWREVDAVLRDAETFSSAIYAESLGPFMGPMMLAMDGEQHRGHRLLVSRAFRASQLAQWEKSLFLSAITRLCQVIVGNGRAELVGEVIAKYPVLVICGMCGVPEEDSPRFLQWAIDIHRSGHEPVVAMEAAQAMRDYLEPLVKERRLRPGNDLISDIVSTEVDGQRLDDEETYGFLRLLLPAGSESTFRTMASALATMLTTPGLLDRALADRSVLPLIVEETIRWEASNTLVTRIATRDTVVGNCAIPAGAALFVFTCAANRDVAQFTDPDRFDPDRAINRHMAFGTGPHQCLGMHLARIELRVGLNAMLDLLPNLRLDPDFPPPVIEGFSFRGPSALHVRFDPPCASSVIGDWLKQENRL